MLSVLVLEDAADVRERLISMVTEIDGLGVHGVASCVSEAHAILATLSPDVALLDLRLPDGSGLDVARAIRARSASAFVAILTAFDTQQMRSTCLAAGADAFISKATGLAELPMLLTSIARGGANS